MSNLRKPSRLLERLIDSFTPRVGQANDVEFDLQTLEDRILYSAAPVPIDLAGSIDVIDTALVDLALSSSQPADVDVVGDAFALASDWEVSNQSFYSGDSLDDVSTALDVEPSTSSLDPPRELIVIDRQVGDYDQLVDDLTKATDGRSFEIIYVDSTASGVERVTEHLRQHGRDGEALYSAIHVVSHGSEGAFHLGGDRVSESSIDSFADSFQAWSSALTEDADLFVYGCDVASTEDGRTLIDSLAQLTQADVAASDDLTGHASRNADWQLEYVHGIADSSVVFSASLQAAWQQTLEFHEIQTPDGAQAQAMGVDGSGNVSGVSASGASPGDPDFDIFLYDVDANGDWINPVLVNQDHQDGIQDTPKIAVAENGIKVVTWTDRDDSSSSKVYAKFYDQNNVALGGEIRLGSNGNVAESNSAVAVDALGNAVITWQTTASGLEGVRAQRFFADGSENGDDFLVLGSDIYAGYTESGAPAVAMNDAGQFVIVWDTDTGDGDPVSGIYARAYDSDGTARTDATLVARTPDVRMFNAAVDIDSAGNFVVAYATLGGDSNGIDVRAEQFDADATSIREFDFVSYDDGDQFAPDVAINSAGEALITWTGEGLTSEGVIDPIETWAASVDLATGDVLQSQWYLGEPGNGQEAIDRYAASVIEMPDGSFLTSHITQVIGSSDNVLSSQLFTGQPDSPTSTIAGVVYEDVNGESDLASFSTVDGASVYLYRDNGDGVRDANDLFVAQTTTANDGQYLFDGELITYGDYYVVVDSKTVLPSVTLNNANGNATWAEQTYASAGGLFETSTGEAKTAAAGALFSGYSGTRSDDATTLAGAEHVIAVSATAEDAGLADFGFSFHVVTNTSGGGDDDLLNDRTVQGSLDQFIRNANELSGANQMRFVARNDANSDDATFWTINVTEELTAITDSNTTIDGTVYQATASGEALQVNARQIGHEGFVGASENYEFTGFDAPELEIAADRTLADADHVRYGLTVTPIGDNESVSNITIRNLSIHGFGQTVAGSEGDGANIFVSGNGQSLSYSGSAATNIVIENNLLGLSADGMTADASQFGSGIRVYGADNGTIEGNYIGNHGQSGIYFQRQLDGLSATESTPWTVKQNQVVNNGLYDDVSDGISLNSTSNATVLDNYIADNAGFGIDSYASLGGHLIQGNTVTGNGVGSVDEGGIRLFGQNTQVLENRIAGNLGAGVVVTSLVGPSPDSFNASAANLVSRNSFEGNTGLAIDLLASLTDGLTFGQLDTDASGALRVDELAGIPLGELGTFNRADTNNDDLIGASEFETAMNDYVSGGDGLSLIQGQQDASGNLGMDPPTIQSAAVYSDRIELSIEMPDEADRIELYVASDNDDNGFGEGVKHLETISRSAMTPDGDGGFTVTLSYAGPLQGSLTAVAIAADGSTSEFGENVATEHAPEWDRTSSERTVSTLEDTAYRFSLSFFETGYTDVDGGSLAAIRVDRLPGSGELVLIDSLTMASTSVAQGMEISANELNQLYFNPAANMHGLETFEVSQSDGSLFSDQSYEVTIEVISANDAPTVDALIEFFVQEGETLLVAATEPNLLSDATDVEGDSLTILDGPSLVGSLGTLEIDQATGAFSYTADPGAVGIDVFDLQVTDGPNVVDSTLQITVASANEAPTVTTESEQTAGENQAHVVTLSGQASDGGAVTFEMVGGADQDLFTIDSGTDSLQFLGSPDFENPIDHDLDGVYEVQVVAVDSDGLRSETTTAIRVTIEDVNDSPYQIVTQVASNLTGSEQTLNGVLNLYDVVGDADADDTLTLSVVQQSQHGQISIQPDGTFTYSRTTDEPIGLDSFKFRLTDRAGESSEDVTVTLRVPFVATQPAASEELEGEQSNSNSKKTNVLSARENDLSEDEDDYFGLVTGLIPSAIFTSGADIIDRSGDSDEETATFDQDLAVEEEGKTYVYALRLESPNVFSRNASADQPVRTVAEIDSDSDVFASAFLQDLEESKEKYLYANAEIGTTEIAASAATMLTMSYVVWNMGSGILLSTFMSSLPAWSAFDVLPVIANAKFDVEDDESIEQIVDA